MIVKELPQCPLDIKRSMRCPKCGGKGMWRRGAEFEGEKLCLSDGCHNVWAPGAIETQLAWEAADQMSMDGAGI